MERVAFVTLGVALLGVLGIFAAEMELTIGEGCTVCPGLLAGGLGCTWTVSP